MSKNYTSKTSTDDYPEITQADFDRATMRKGFKPVEKKQRITILLDAGIIGYFKTKAGNRGYQTLINEALKRVIATDLDSKDQGGLENTLRRILKEELRALKG